MPNLCESKHVSLGIYEYVLYILPVILGLGFALFMLDPMIAIGVLMASYKYFLLYILAAILILALVLRALYRHRKNKVIWKVATVLVIFLLLIVSTAPLLGMYFYYHMFGRLI